VRNFSLRTSSRRRYAALGGFTLTEMLMTIALLSFVTLTAGQLFRKSMMLSFDDRNYQNRASEVSSAIDQLRRDVWGSAQIQVKAPGEVHLQAVDGSGQTWRIDADGSVTRTPDGQATPTRWEAIAADWGFAGDAVSLSVIDSGEQSAGQVRLVSQVLLGRNRL
jgi:prepilin-type N-terminal cleavage/methylation domain-containing protein